MKQPPKIQSVLIDPYKREVRKIELATDLAVWYKLLQCQCVDCQRLFSTDNKDVSLDIWFDDEFLCRDCIGPAFQIAAGTSREAVFHGYAFLAAHDDEGNTISLDKEGMKKSNAEIQQILRIRFEVWEKRLDKNLFLEERLRTPELELPGQFRFIDLPVDNTGQSGTLR